MTQPLTRESYVNAKKRANQRLSTWITNVKNEREFGIPRLQKEFPHAFKRIEWISAKSTDSNKKNDTKLQLPQIKTKKSEMCQAFTSDKGSPGDRPEGMSTVPLEDHQIHDSNSSNLSSSMGHTKDGEIRYSDRKTPFNATPLLLVDPENKECNDSFVLDPKIQSKPEVNCTRVKARSIATDHLQKRRLSDSIGASGSMQFRRRRRGLTRRNARVIGVGQPVDKFDPEDDERADSPTELEELDQAPSTLSRRRSSSVISTHKGHSKAGAYFKVTSKAGPMDVMFKRRPMQTHGRQRAPSRHELPLNLTSEEKRQERLNNFRRMVRLLIHVRVLLNVSRIRIQEEEKSKEFKRFDDGKEISFDPTAFKTAVGYGGLTTRARKALKKNPADRTEDDARVLMDVMLRLPVFNKYPKYVKQSLAKKMWYDMFQDGRVILKQGDPGTRMYFIVSGEVDHHRTDEIVAGEPMSYHVRTLAAGSTFGELALIRNIRREFTTICKGTSEFLSLSKDEFNQALRSRWEKDCNLRFSFLRNCELFKEWTDKQLQVCADSSELKEYNDNKVIIGDCKGPTDRVFFVRKGSCEIVRKICVVRHQSPYLRPNILLPDTARLRTHFMDKPYCRDRRINREETRFLTVTTLSAGSYFGAGENLQDTYIISRGKTDCVVINSAQFSIQGKSEQLRRMKADRDNMIPPNHVLYQRFQLNRKWYEYRNQLLHDVLRKKDVVRMGSISDVPISVLNKPTIPKDLIHFDA